MSRAILFLAVVAVAAACGGSGATTSPPGGGPSVRGPVFIERVDVLLMESYPVQVALEVIGTLPTPCHVAEFDVGDVAADGTITVDLYSLSDPGEACSQVLEPFRVSIPVGSFTEGSHVAVLNGTAYPFTV